MQNDEHNSFLSQSYMNHLNKYESKECHAMFFDDFQHFRDNHVEGFSQSEKRLRKLVADSDIMIVTPKSRLHVLFHFVQKPEEHRSVSL